MIYLLALELGICWRKQTRRPGAEFPLGQGRALPYIDFGYIFIIFVTLIVCILIIMFILPHNNKKWT
jgi:hypothetical protein